jgi:hypothetical protein
MPIARRKLQHCRRAVDEHGLSSFDIRVGEKHLQSRHGDHGHRGGFESRKALGPPREHHCGGCGELRVADGEPGIADTEDRIAGLERRHPEVDMLDNPGDIGAECQW